MKLRLTLIALLLGASLAQTRPQITVGSKLDAEGKLLGSMIRLLLESDGFNVRDRTGLGTTDINRKALLAGEIDLYPEYTGTAISNFFKGQTIPQGAAKDAALSYKTVKALDKKLNDIDWLERAPANNTFAIALPKALAEREKLRTLEDFARYVNRGGSVKLVGSQEFIERDDALKSFEEAYDFKLNRQTQVIVIAGATTAQTESAAAQGTNGANAAMAYGTDGALDALELIVLDDPKGAQPVYQPAPTVRGEVLRKYPRIAALLDRVFKGLDEKTLQNLNRDIDLEGKTPLDVARNYLKAKRFIH